VLQYQSNVGEFIEKERIKLEEYADEDSEAKTKEQAFLRSDKCEEAINSSFESQKEYIEELIAQCTKEEEARMKSRTTEIGLQNYTKNRTRVSEIFDVVALYEQVITMVELEYKEESEEEDD